MGGHDGERPAVLYLTRTGLLEPLGQSQVLGYLRGLSAHYSFTLISMERSSDVDDKVQLARIEALCREGGIRWIRLPYRNRPRVLAAIRNGLSLVIHAYREQRRVRAHLIHARSYIPAAAAWVVSRLTDVPYIFDMRSLWPEELVTSRRIHRGSTLHKLIVRAERRLLADAGMVVSLTRAAVGYLNRTHPRVLGDDRVRVIPTCTDLVRFSPHTGSRGDGPIIGCHGSLLNGWFRVDLLGAMFSRLMARLPDARFEIISREDPAAIRRAMGAAIPGTDWRDRLEIGYERPSDIHVRLQRQMLSVFFYASGAASELGRSPTRMGEALGCGVPVLTNVGVGDVAAIVRSGNVGIVLEQDDERSLDRAADDAVALLSDPSLRRRCRRVAEQVFALDEGVEAYRSIYTQLIPAV